MACYSVATALATFPKVMRPSYWRRTFAAGPGFHRLPVPRRSNLIFASIGQKLICSGRGRASTFRWSCCLWTAEFYIEFNRFDHEGISDSFKCDSRIQIGPSAAKVPLCLFE